MAKILVVEDDDDMRCALRTLLAREGYCVMAVPSAETALEIFPFERFDLAIVDLLLPGMDGAELCRLVRQEKSLAHLLMVLVTAMPHRLGIELNERDAYWAPADRFIDKRDCGSKLLPAVRELLEAGLVKE